jgi:hypothetical protein
MKTPTAVDAFLALDWYTPLVAILDSSVEGVVLNIDEIWAMDKLKKKGIIIRYTVIIPYLERIGFSVKKEQIPLVNLLLRKMGIAVIENRAAGAAR